MWHNRIAIAACAVLVSGIFGLSAARSQQAVPGQVNRRLVLPIDENSLATLRGHVRKDLTAERDLGAVEDGMQLRMYLLLRRSPAQQADLDNLLARQQQPTAPEYHKWLTPKEFGARFGASAEDIATLTAYLESHGFQVRGVLNNASMIEFAGSANQVRVAFHAELHYYRFLDGKYAANAQDPQIPSALAPVVAGIQGLSKIPIPNKRTPGHPVAYDAQSHRWLDIAQTLGEQPKYNAGSSSYVVTPQDFYTIYNVNPIFTGGNLGAGATIGLPEPTDMQFGTVNTTTGAATGGDVATFRTLFGVAGTLNMTVLHGPTAASPTCGDPGVTSAVGEAALDAEWANAVAPSANLVFMACSSSAVGDGFTTALATLIDNNISDVISSSYGNSEAVITSADFTEDDTLLSQAAAQGQSFIDAAGDAGSADADQNGKETAIHGLNVDQFASPPLATAVGGTDFADTYDAQMGGPAQSTYWGNTNSAFYGDALGYIPETPWNSSCADSIIANANGGLTGAGYCATLSPTSQPSINATIIGGGGGFSTHYPQPSFQAGIPGLSPAATMRALPDIAFFAAEGYWGHSIIQCDSTIASTACTSPSTFETAGGTSFTAPQFAGVAALLVTKTGERQGTLNPALYALAKAQYAAPATATGCYSNGQTNNIGVTTGLPAAACIFNDVTTGNNDEPCQAGSTNCYVSPGQTYGILSTTGASSLTVGYPSGVGFDETTGLGSVNIANLIGKWNSAYSSTTGLGASLTSITASQSTQLTATVAGGTPAGYTGAVPAVIGSVTFYAGAASLGSCTLSGGTCSITVLGSAMQSGANSVTATYAGAGTYPPSTSGIVTVTVTGAAAQAPAITSANNATFTVGTAGSFIVTTTASPTSSLSEIGTLPGGLTFHDNGNGTATISGTPNAGTKGSYPLNLTAANGTLPNATQSFTLTVVANSQLWIGDANNTTAAFSVTGAPYLTTPESGAGSGGVAIDSAGNVWSVSSGSNSVAEFAGSGTVVNSGYTGGGLSTPAAVAIDGAGQVWVANSNNSISVLSSSGAPLSPGAYTGGGLSSPSSIAIDISGNLWIANSGSNSVTEVLGAAAPTVPLATGAANNSPATKP